jgi:hypothetical protein
MRSPYTTFTQFLAKTVMARVCSISYRSKSRPSAIRPQRTYDLGTKRMVLSTSIEVSGTETAPPREGQAGGIGRRKDEMDVIGHEAWAQTETPSFLHNSASRSRYTS